MHYALLDYERGTSNTGHDLNVSASAGSAESTLRGQLTQYLQSIHMVRRGPAFEMYLTRVLLAVASAVCGVHVVLLDGDKLGVPYSPRFDKYILVQYNKIRLCTCITFRPVYPR